MNTDDSLSGINRSPQIVCGMDVCWILFHLCTSNWKRMNNKIIPRNKSLTTLPMYYKKKKNREIQRILKISRVPEFLQLQCFLWLVVTCVHLWCESCITWCWQHFWKCMLWRRRLMQEKSEISVIIYLCIQTPKKKLYYARLDY